MYAKVDDRMDRDLLLRRPRASLYRAARSFFPAHWAGRETTLAARLVPKRGLHPPWSWSTRETVLQAWRHRGAANDVSFVGLCRPGLLSPKRKSWVALWWMQRPAALYTRRRKPLAKVTLFVYKVQPAAAPTKAPPKTSLFSERGPRRHNPTKEMSLDAP